ncbi:MAG TPA: G1 family glutamic endopeptidase [Gaiellaceae bacterium]|jgi:hypothetical protein
MRIGTRTRRLAGVCAATLAALAAGAVAGAASSPTPLTISGNWSGYAVSGNGQSFTDVTGSWTQPKVACRLHPSSSSSFWVGLGGFAADATGVEQIGTSADCRDGMPVHYAWFELLPGPAVPIRVRVSPGDKIVAEVRVRGASVNLWLTDVTTGAVYTSTRTLAQPDLSSAEWIAEAPSLCVRRCRALPLASFGATTFTSLSATAGSHTGTISDARWSASSIQLSPRGAGSAWAMPSELSLDGTSFTVTTAERRRHHRHP